MRFLQYEQNGNRRLGVEMIPRGDIVDLGRSDSSLPTDMRSFIEGGDSSMQAAKRAVTRGDNIVKRHDAKIVAPIYNPEKVMCVGMNYIKDANTKAPSEPVIFNKFPSCIIGPDDNLQYPEETECLDWEAELAIVIKRKAKKVKEEEAMDYIFGFTVANDVSARDWQSTKGKNGGQVLLGKAMDGFCPLGPVIVTADDLKDPHNVGLRCKVNGVIKQDSNTSKLIFKSGAIIAHITRFITLNPGDLILTGAPPGSAVHRNPPDYLQKGDVVECEIDGIGKIVNKIV